VTAHVMTPEERIQGLGATDVVNVAGVGYGSPIETYREKRGEGSPMEPTWRMRMGQILEDAIADAYSESTGRRLARVSTVRHKVYPFLYAHPDRRVIGEPGLVEIKATERRSAYDDGPPPGVRVQCQWQLGLTGRQWCDVAVLSGTSGIDIHRVDRDQALIDALEAMAVDFWQNHVLAGVPPEVDGTDAYRRYLAERHPRELVAEVVATPEQQLLVDELRGATDAEKTAGAHKALVENRIRDSMGDAGRLIARNAVVSWLKEKPRVSWKDVAEVMARATRQDLAAFAAADTEGKEGPRVLRVKWQTDE
jgi:putative phage-type endonuclease